MPLDPNPQSQAVKLPEWGAFKLEMLGNQAYQRLSSKSLAQRAVSRLESLFSIESENFVMASAFWQQIMRECPREFLPGADEAKTWKEIAQRTNMPISFNDEGYMEFFSHDDS
jgi:hypothetical protein